MKSNPLLYLRLPNWLGDVCMSLPVLEAFLARNYQIVVCARSWAKDLLAGYPLLDFVPISGKWYTDAKRLRAHKAHHQHIPIIQGLSLPDSLSSALVFKLAGIPAAGYKDDGRSCLLKWPIAKPTTPLHAVESWYHLAYQASLHWEQAIAPKAAQHLHLAGIEAPNPEKFGLDAKKTNILIAPTAIGLHKGKNKVWPHFEELTQRLLAAGFGVYMCPPPNEVEQAIRNAPSATRIAALALPDFAQLCKSVDLVICNDSGVSHIAAAVDTPQITLIGVTDVSRTGPWSDQAHCLGKMGTWASVDQVLDSINRLSFTKKQE